MDQGLLELVRDWNVAQKLVPQQKVRFVDPHAGQIEIQTSSGPKPYTLRPLSELYGQGTGSATIDPKDERFEPLLMAIELPIKHHDLDQGLSDGAVSIVLERLAMTPEAEPGADELARQIQLSLRLVLSLNDYSRQDVKGAIRKIAKSVTRHTRSDGPRGYLDFIQKYVPG